MDLEMSVIKRCGNKEIISFDKILTRIKNLGENTLKINYTMLAMKIIDRLYVPISNNVEPPILGLYLHPGFSG